MPGPILLASSGVTLASLWRPACASTGAVKTSGVEGSHEIVLADHEIAGREEWAVNLNAASRQGAPPA
jgi:hypothetical protein